MPLDLNTYKALLAALAKDERLTVWHLATMFGIIQLAESSDINAPIYISRKKLMETAHIKNFVTYHKCIKELQALGYITYVPSYHPAFGSKVYLL